MLNERLVLDTYGMYLEMKNHFNGKIIYNLDHAKNSFSNPGYMDKRKDIDTFINVSEKYGRAPKKLESLLISLLKNDKNAWIGEILTSEFIESIHIPRMNRLKILTYTIDKDINNLSRYMDENNLSLYKLTKCINLDRPEIANRRLNVSDEFMALLNDDYSFLCQFTENPLWISKSLSLSRYSFLIELPNESIKENIKNFIVKYNKDDGVFHFDSRKVDPASADFLKLWD